MNFDRAEAVMPGGVSSPARSFRQIDRSPICAKEGKGERLTDTEGTSYIDYLQAWGASILGHAHEKVVKAVNDQMARGSIFGLTCELEVAVAEKIVHHVPSAEKVRFVTSGTEATMTALRLARHITARPLVIKFSGGYHGHSGEFYRDNDPTLITLPYNNEEAITNYMAKNGSNVAAIIIEPIAGNMGVVPAKTSFLKALRALTKAHGALLIFDEVITGFRVGLSGAQGLYGITPDLTTLGKIVGGGLPAAALCGPSEFLDRLAPAGPLFHAGTMAGHPLAMAAALATLEVVETPGFYEELEKKGAYLCDNVKGLCINRVGSLFTPFVGKKSVTCFEDLSDIDPLHFQTFYQYMLERGILLAPSQFEASFITSEHTEESLKKTKEALEAFTHVQENLCFC